MARVILLNVTMLLVALTSAPAATLRGRVTADDLPGGVLGVNVVVHQDTVATGMGAATDSEGRFVISAIPAGKYVIHFDYVGYQPEVREVLLAGDSDLSIFVKLSPEAVSGQEEVVVTTSVTRHEVSISNTPVRVEVMVPEELQDKIAFSSSVDGALRYSGGIVVNTSRNLYEAENVRLRGVDSRYLLLLSDQAPVLGYQPEEVGIWTLPLVGVKQLEIVKGDYSPLYGFGQAGVINAVLRTPFSDSLDFFGLARSNIRDDHYTGFYAGRRLGFWGLSGIISGESLDLGGGKDQRYVVLPRVDYHSSAVRAFISGALLGSRYDGDRTLLERRAVSAGVESPISEAGKFQFQAQFADQSRGYLPHPAALQTHSQISYVTGQFVQNFASLTSLAGFDGYGEDWEMTGANSGTATKESRWALFLQEEWAINKNWSVLYGGRMSRVQIKSAGAFAYQDSQAMAETGDISDVRWVTQQMLSLLWKPNYFTSYRLAGSYGLIPPSSHYVQSLPDTLHLFVPSRSITPERFWNASFDVRRVSRLAGWAWTSNISLFVTGLENHIDIFTSNEQSELRNASRYLIPGAELFSRLDVSEDAAILLGYTFLDPNDAYENSPGAMLPLPRHQVNGELDWEIEGTGARLEIEGKLVSGQKTPSNLFRRSAPPYAILGATLEYSLGPTKLFGGVENAADFRQDDDGPLWGPRQGREFYLGLKALL